MCRLIGLKTKWYGPYASKLILNLFLVTQASGGAPPSILKQLLTDLSKRSLYSEEQEDCVRWTAGTLFGGKLKISGSSYN